MKLSMTNLVVLTCLSLAIVGCGGSKKGSSSSSSSNNGSSTGTNNLGTNTPITGTSSGSAAETKLNTWLAETQSGYVNSSIRVVKIECAQFLGTQCITSAATRAKFWPASAPRSFNSELANILVTDVNAGFTKETVSQSNNLFLITFKKASTGEEKRYFIDTSYHAVVNPVEYHRYKNNKLENKECYPQCRF